MVEWIGLAPIRVLPRAYTLPASPLTDKRGGGVAHDVGATPVGDCSARSIRNNYNMPATYVVSGAGPVTFRSHLRRLALLA
jgi:hypothetical protein